MKLPLSWLKDYVDIDCSVEELETKLFSCGFEVEEKIYVGKNIEKIVTCRIQKIEKHPNADKLSVTQVDAGDYGILQIITSATNIFEGAVVPVALDGAVLADGNVIKTGEIRGVKSCGMFCSGEELGITDDWYEGASLHGILILDNKYPLGADVKKLLEIEDVMFDINITANRPDCQSILGLAREVAAALGKPLKMPDLTYKTDSSVSTINTLKVTDKAFDLCPRYKSHLVTEIKLEKSPLWMRRKLFSMGLRSINNIVDITNFVLLEIGQPMHAFDLSDLNGNEINVRRAKKDEKIITLDEKEFNLSENNLVIADAVKPVALAGVMGGLNSEIKNTTSSVVFESAKFARDNIRKTSRTLGQRSDSSARYEKGVDYLSVEIGMARALNLISKLGCGKIASDEYDLIDNPLQEKTINTTFDKVNGVLGIKVPSEDIVNILKRLGFKTKSKGEELSVTVPLYREDMEDYPDIAEEIIREYGYSHIKSSLLTTSAITNGGRNYEQTKVEELKNLLIGYGFNEIITYSFISEKDFEIFGIKNENIIKLLNPISEDMSLMRTSLLPSVIRAVCYNLNRKNEEGRMFELAKTYIADRIPLEKLPKERECLAFAQFGEKEDFFTVKGVVEGIIDNFCNGTDVKYINSQQKCMHPTRSADIILFGDKVGFFGQLNPTVLEKLGVDKPVFVAEIDYEKLKQYFNDKIIVKPISKFPPVERDLAIVVEQSVPCEVLIDTIKQSGGEYLDSVNLFDVYQGDGIEKGKKSMAYSLLFRADERTLNIEEIEEKIKDILNSLRKNHGATLR